MIICGDLFVNVVYNPFLWLEPFAPDVWIGPWQPVFPCHGAVRGENDFRGVWVDGVALVSWSEHMEHGDGQHGWKQLMLTIVGS